MARYVDMDVCPCNKCKTMMSGDCLPLYEGCQNYEEWYEGVDAIPVVRCRDCVHNDDCMNDLCGYGRKDDDFCSHGERKDGNSDETD